MVPALRIVQGLSRIALGWIFLWAFFDKVFGLGFSTAGDKAWLDGVSPTYGFLKFGLTGIFAPAFQTLAGSAFVDWLFMLGLLGLGVALLLGIGMKIATYAGTLLLLLLYLAVVPPEHNPIIDEHIVYALLLWILYLNSAGEFFGLGKKWGKTTLVKKYPVLR